MRKNKLFFNINGLNFIPNFFSNKEQYLISKNLLYLFDYANFKKSISMKSQNIVSCKEHYKIKNIEDFSDSTKNISMHYLIDSVSEGYQLLNFLLPQIILFYHNLKHIYRLIHIHILIIFYFRKQMIFVFRCI